MGRVFAGTEGKKRELRRAMEKLVSQRVSEREREGRISLGGKLVAQWGFLLEFNLSGREGRGGGREGPAWVSSSMEYV